MQTKKLFTLLICLIFYSATNAQSIKADPENWTVFNREVTFDNEIIHLDAQKDDGLLWLNGSDFKNGTLELDIKGKDLQGQSFVGIAFHGLDDSTFDAVYFRPFNFKNTERDNHSTQYISMPNNNWSVLREAYPGKFENKVNPVPNPNDWFHAKVVIKYPKVKVYVNDAKEPSLEIDQISDRKHGKIGFWVGYGSEGWFKNLKIISE